VFCGGLVVFCGGLLVLCGGLLTAAAVRQGGRGLMRGWPVS